jgi:VCBS repeat protein/FG-GAP repeat protein
VLHGSHGPRTPRRPRGATLAVALLAAFSLGAVASVGTVAGAAPSRAAAPARTASAVQLGLVRSPFSGAPYAALFNNGGTTESFSTPAVGDVTGDSQPEIVLGGMDGWVRIFSLGGGLVRAQFTGNGAVQASPLLYDFDHDGKLDILVANAGTGDVWVFRGPDGATLFHNHTIGSPGPAGVFGTPAIGDINHDGVIEIAVTSYDNHLYVWRYPNASLVFNPVWVHDTIWSSPVIADLDHNGQSEIVFGTDMDHGQPFPQGGWIWVVNADGSVRWNKWVADQTIWSTPAVTDVNGDGFPDIVVGTGLNFPGAGKHVYALDRFGNALPGWPTATLGAVMASPAIGTLGGVGKVTVVGMEGGYITAIRPNGQVLWTVCGTSWGCSPGYPTHGGVSIADVNGDGMPDVVSALDHDLEIRRLSDGAGEASIGIDGVQLSAPASAPTIFSAAGETRIVVTGTYDLNGGGRSAGDVQRVYEFGTKHLPGTLDWPTFKQNMRRSGTLLNLDTTPPSGATVTVPPSPVGAVPTTVSWQASDTGANATGVANFDIDVSFGGRPWARWYTAARVTSRSGSTGGGSAPFYGLPGGTYSFRARARDASGNVGAYSPTVSLIFAGGATHSQQFTAAYTTASDGSLGAVASAPLAAGTVPGGLIRGIAMLHNGIGGYTVDAWGGLHPFGAAPSASTGAYWRGWDIIRGIAVNPDNTHSGYALDGFGGLHAFGGAPRVSGAYWRNWDIARGIVLLPTSTMAHPAGYVLDAFGGLHPFGAAHQVAITGYWRGWAIVRGIALDPDGRGGYTLDAFGGLHAFDGAPHVGVSGYWRGWDIARGVIMIHDPDHHHPGGYTVDGFGGLHPFGTAHTVSSTGYWHGDVVKGAAIAP